MTVPVDNGSKSQPSEDLVRALGGEISTSSGTVAYVRQPNSIPEDFSQVSGREDDRTVISQRPVAAPEEFYRSMPLSELAGVLEGRQLDHFAVDQMIGGGGMGAVFRGRDLRLDRVVAIKVIPSARRDPETLRRFRLEAQAAAKLDHPNIARVYYVGEAEQWNYIVFEFIDGVNIRDLVEMEGPLSVDDAVFYTRQVAEALQHAYDREVVHRDIKPSNVLVTAAGAAKVVDMGLARNTALDRSTADETASGVTLGTFDYISPEQARNPRDADVRSDLYSLGCTLFYMLTGNPPFPEGTALQKLLSHGSQAPPDPRGWREDLSDELFEITMKLMAKRPGDRYQTPTELISDLVMLAEVENLPRSQSPGTMLVANHSAQPSLLEANLPWLVAVAFLLASTILWLASVQSQVNVFNIGPLEYPTRVAEETSAASGPPVTPDEVKSPLDAPATSDAPRSVVTQASSRNEIPQPPAVAGANGSSEKVGSVPPTLQPAPSVNANPELTPPATPSAGSQAVGPTFGQAIFQALSSSDAKLQTQNSTGGQATNPSHIGSEGPPTEAPITRLIVSAELPDGVEPSRWESSLASAVARLGQLPANGTALVPEIEIRGRIALRRPLETSGRELHIVSGAGGGAVVEVAQTVFASNQQPDGVWRLQAAELTVQGVAFEIELVAGEIGQQRKGLFALADSSKLDLKNCTVTVRSDSPSSRFYVVSCNEQAGSRGSQPSGSMVVRAVMSVFRGDTTLIGLNFTEQTIDNRADISLTDTLVAVSGSVLEVNAPTGDTQSQRFVHLFCDQSTMVSEQPFAVLSYAGNLAPLVGLNRTSQNCIYWSRAGVPHVQINGARRQSLLGNFNLLLLQGVTNLYDANIQELCQAFQGSEKTATFGFVEASTSGWLTERASESRVRWRAPDFPRMPLSQSTPRDFSVADGLFVPGIKPINLPLGGVE